jgi:hypothetical protein
VVTSPSSSPCSCILLEFLVLAVAGSLLDLDRLSAFNLCYTYHKKSTVMSRQTLTKALIIANPKASFPAKPNCFRFPSKTSRNVMFREHPLTPPIGGCSINLRCPIWPREMHSSRYARSGLEPRRHAVRPGSPRPKESGAQPTQPPLPRGDGHGKGKADGIQGGWVGKGEGEKLNGFMIDARAAWRVLRCIVVWCVAVSRWCGVLRCIVLSTAG